MIRVYIGTTGLPEFSVSMNLMRDSFVTIVLHTLSYLGRTDGQERSWTFFIQIRSMVPSEAQTSISA